MKQLLILAVFLLFLGSFVPSVHAQTAPTQSYSKGEVTKVTKPTTSHEKSYAQLVTVTILDGPEKGIKKAIPYGQPTEASDDNVLAVGDIVVIQKNTFENKTLYTIVDQYRLDIILWLIGGFFALVILVAGLKGVGSILGMFVSLFVIVAFIVPQILAGHDPVFITILGSLVIMVSTLYLAHGFSKQTSVAVIATGVILLITGVLSHFFVQLTQLTGTGNEEAVMLQFGNVHTNLKGLLLGGIIIGALGVLDDVTTSQTAAIVELHKTNPSLTFLDLIKKGHRIGKEHIASLVNTLILVYAGASLALFILFVVNPAHQPYWVILNSQSITEEIVRTLAGSIGLILGVPISTGFAAWYAARGPK